MFCDMRGFTGLSEKLPPEEVVSGLNEFYSLMIDITIAHDGTINKFLGDGFMAVFGAPLAHGDDAANAVRAGLALVDGCQPDGHAAGAFDLCLLPALLYRRYPDQWHGRTVDP